MDASRNRKRFETWLEQLKAGTFDLQETKTLATWLAAQPHNQVASLLTAIIDDPETQEQEAWQQAWLADEIPIIEHIPTFDFSFLSPPPAVTPKHNPQPSSMLQRFEQRIQTISIAVQEILRGLQPEPTLAWNASRSTQSVRKTIQKGDLIFEDRLEGRNTVWGGELTILAEDERTCTVEVGIYRLDPAGGEIKDIPIVLQCGEFRLTEVTNQGGVVEFRGVPLAQIEQVEQIEIRIGSLD